MKIKISKSKILEWLTFRMEIKASKIIYFKGQIWESATLRVVLPFANFFRKILVFQIEKIL